MSRSKPVCSSGISVAVVVVVVVVVELDCWSC